MSRIDAKFEYLIRILFRDRDRDDPGRDDEDQIYQNSIEQLGAYLYSFYEAMVDKVEQLMVQQNQRE